VHENRYRLLLVTVTAGMYASFFVKSETKIFETLNVEEHDHVYFYVQALRVVMFVDREEIELIPSTMAPPIGVWYRLEI
jgi:hypothetical protein